MMQNKVQLVVFLAGILSKASCDLYNIVLIEEKKNWTEAQSYCREKHMDLATVQSDEDRAKLKEAANDVNFQSDAWIGFYGDVWHWSYQSKPVSYTNWDSSQLGMSDTAWVCGYLKSSGLWGYTSCADSKIYLCETDKQDPHFFHSSPEKWHDAQIHCIATHDDMVTIADDTKNAYLANILVLKGHNDAWIGLYKKPWLWSDNTGVSWSSVKWESGQPDNVKGNECARADTDGLMSAETCSTPLPFYCSTTYKKIKRVRFSFKSDGHLNESMVMEAIEMKMKQILSDQGINITWNVQPNKKIFQLQETQDNTQPDEKIFQWQKKTQNRKTPEHTQETCEVLQ